MNRDFTLIPHKFPEDLEELHIYPVGDTQVGSAGFNKVLFRNWRDRVLKDPLAKVVIVGDMLNNGLKNSKTNVYKEKMSPSEAKMWLYEELLPIAGKIIGCVTGNHEWRSINETDDDPLHDIMCMLGLKDFYGENIQFLKVNLGKRNATRQISYNLVLGHGVSKNKTEQFGYTIDGMDILITGHIHTAYSRFPAKIVIDSQNEVVRTVGFTHIVVPSFDEYGGYSVRGMYQPQDSCKIPMIILNGKHKEVNVSWITEKST